MTPSGIIFALAMTFSPAQVVTTTDAPQAQHQLPRATMAVDVGEREPCIVSTGAGESTKDDDEDDAPGWWRLFMTLLDIYNGF
jgi:hypothetical protein